MCHRAARSVVNSADLSVDVRVGHVCLPQERERRWLQRSSKGCVVDELSRAGRCSTVATERTPADDR